MIGRIDIRANAAHPNFPIPPVYMFAGAPSSPRVFGVPARMGSWAITAVSIAVAYPDNSTRTVALTQVDGTWIGVIPACATTGAVQNGVQIVADGTDENGDAVTGYCLGVGDLFVMERDFTATADGTRYYFHYCEEVPTTPQVGDVTYTGGALTWFDGTTWRDFGGGPQADWNQTDTTAPDYIKNKPTIPTVDAALSPTSENPVQNKAVKAALDGKRGLMDLAVYEELRAVWHWHETHTGESGTLVLYSGVPDNPYATVFWKAQTASPTFGTLELAFVGGIGIWDLSNGVGLAYEDTTSSWDVTSLTMEGDPYSFEFTAETGLVSVDTLARDSQLAGKADKSEMSVTPGTGANADKTTIQLKSGTSAVVLTEHQSLAGLAREYTFSDVQTISSAGTEQLPNEITPVDAQNKRVSVEAVNAYIAVALPAASANGHIRDFMLTLDCSSLTEGDEPTVTWGVNFHPRTDAGTDFACAAGLRNVYYISEYATGEFIVGGWQETEGGNA